MEMGKGRALELPMPAYVKPTRAAREELRLRSRHSCYQCGYLDLVGAVCGLTGLGRSPEMMESLRCYGFVFRGCE